MTKIVLRLLPITASPRPLRALWRGEFHVEGRALRARRRRRATPGVVSGVVSGVV